MWGIDDPTFGSLNVVVQDARYYSCVVNMVLLPTPLKAFTDFMPEVKAMLRTCSTPFAGAAVKMRSLASTWASRLGGRAAQAVGPEGRATAYRWGRYRSALPSRGMLKDDEAPFEGMSNWLARSVFATRSETC